MIERHWDGIAAYCQPENKVSLGVGRGQQTRFACCSDARMAIGTRSTPKLEIIAALLTPLPALAGNQIQL